MVPLRGARPFPPQPFQAATRAHGQSLFPPGNHFAGLGLVGPQGPRAIRAFARMPPTQGFPAAPQCARVGMQPRCGRAWDFLGVFSPFVRPTPHVREESQGRLQGAWKTHTLKMLEVLVDEPKPATGFAHLEARRQRRHRCSPRETRCDVRCPPPRGPRRRRGAQVPGALEL